jgi:hypothetical protein
MGSEIASIYAAFVQPEAIRQYTKVLPKKKCPLLELSEERQKEEREKIKPPSQIDAGEYINILV